MHHNCSAFSDVVGRRRMLKLYMFFAFVRNGFRYKVYNINTDYKHVYKQKENNKSIGKVEITGIKKNNENR